MRFKFESSKRFVLWSLVVNSAGYLTFCWIQLLLSPPAPVISLLLSAFLMLPISFLINRKLVFRSEEDAGLQFIKFLSTYSGAIASGALILTILHTVVSNPYLAQLLSALLVGGATFVVHLYWTFESKAM